MSRIFSALGDDLEGNRWGDYSPDSSRNGQMYHVDTAGAYEIDALLDTIDAQTSKLTTREPLPERQLVTYVNKNGVTIQRRQRGPNKRMMVNGVSVPR